MRKISAFVLLVIFLGITGFVSPSNLLFSAEGEYKEEIPQMEEQYAPQEESSYDEDIEELELNIVGMTCNKCEDTIKAALLKCNSVKSADVSHEEANAFITVNVDEADYDEIIAAVRKAGFSFLEDE